MKRDANLTWIFHAFVPNIISNFIIALRVSVPFPSVGLDKNSFWWDMSVMNSRHRFLIWITIRTLVTRSHKSIFAPAGLLALSPWEQELKTALSRRELMVRNANSLLLTFNGRSVKGKISFPPSGLTDFLLTFSTPEIDSSENTLKLQMNTST